jgi:hypothetical protein
MNASKTVKENLEQAIKDRSFNIFEITGFSMNPKNALLAGAAIGYRVGLSEGQEAIERLTAFINNATLKGE